MRCLYCNKRLWLAFSKERVFCSKQHQAAYHDELSAMRRLMEFTVSVEPPAIVELRNQKPSKIDCAIPPVAVPPLCNFVVERGPEPAIPDLPATAVLLEAEPFSGPIQLPSGSMGLVVFTLASATEPAGEIAAIANERIAACRVQSKRSRRTQRSSAAKSRTKRQRLP
jgi:hypothetical protein